MKRKNILILLAFLFISFVSNAFALLPLGFYTGFRGGMKVNTNSVGSGQNLLKGGSSPSIGAMAGIKFFSLRGELEYIFRPNSLEVKSAALGDKSNSQQVMANVYYTFLDLPIIDFYINAGLGTNKMNSPLIASYDSSVWSAGFGVDVSLLLVSVEAGYRYFNMGNVTTVGGVKNKLDSHDVYVGLKFGF